MEEYQKIEGQKNPETGVENTAEVMQQDAAEKIEDITTGVNSEEANKKTENIIKMLEKSKEFSQEAQEFFEHGGEITPEDFNNMFDDIFGETAKKEITENIKEALRKDLSPKQKEKYTKNWENMKKKGLFDGIAEYNTNAESRHNTYTQDMENKMQLMPSMSEMMKLFPRPTINKNNYKNFSFDFQNLFEANKESQEAINKKMKEMGEKMGEGSENTSSNRIEKFHENIEKHKGRLQNERKEQNPEERKTITQEAKKQVTIMKRLVEGKGTEKTISNVMSHVLVPLIERIIKIKKEKNPDSVKIKERKKEIFTSNEVQKAFSPTEQKEINQESCTNNAHKFIDGFAKQHNRTPEQIKQAKTTPLPAIQPLGTETPTEMATVITYCKKIIQNQLSTENQALLDNYITQLQQGKITPHNQKAYNNFLHIFATGKGLSTTEIYNQKTTREQEQKIADLQNNFEKAKNPDEQIKVLQEAVEVTNESIGKPSLQSALDALMSGDFEAATKELGKLFQYIFNIIGGKNMEANEKLFNHKKVDFTNTRIDNLIGKNTRNKEGKIENTEKIDQTAYKKLFDENGHINESLIGENSLYMQIKQKKRKTGLTQDIMYTSALSKLKDTLYLKRQLAKNNDWTRDTEVKKDNPDTTEDESANNPTRDQMQKDLKTYRSKTKQSERILHNIKPGDLIFFVGGDTLKNGKVQKNIINKGLEIAGGPGNHVGMVGPDGKTLIHSTMKTYGSGKSGSHEVDLIDELNSRPNAGLVIGRFDDLTKAQQAQQKTEGEEEGKGEQKLITGQQLAQTASDLAKTGIKYDHGETVTSITHRMTTKDKVKDRRPEKYNCASFVNKIFATQADKDQQSEENYGDLSASQTGIPAEIMGSDQLSLEYTTQRKG